MQVIVLGSGCAIPNPSRGPAGYLVRAGDTCLLMDCGSGTVQRLARAGVWPDALHGIFLSHMHPDHVGDLGSLLFALRVGGAPDERPLPIHLGPGAAAWMQASLAPFGSWTNPTERPLEFTEHATDTFEVGTLLCRVRPVAHHTTSLGIQIQSADGCRIAYLGDTDLCDGAIELCRGVDLAIVECSHTDDEEVDGHLSPRKIAMLAKAARPSALLLSHLYPHTAQTNLGQAVLDHGCEVPVTVAEDGMGIAIDAPDEAD